MLEMRRLLSLLFACVSSPRGPIRPVCCKSAKRAGTSLEQFEPRTMLAADLFFGFPGPAEAEIIVSDTRDTATPALAITPQSPVFVDFAVDRSGDTPVTFDLAVRVDGQLVATATDLLLGPSQSLVIEDLELGPFSGGEHDLELEILNTDPVEDVTNNIVSTRFVVVSGEPDLIPYQPPGWEDIIAVSPVEDNSGSDSSIVSDTDELFIDFALKNVGTDAAIGDFDMLVFVDDATEPFVALTVSGELLPNAVESFLNIALPPLPVGQHALRLEIDGPDGDRPHGKVPEADEQNNSYSRTFYVAGSGSIHGRVVEDPIQPPGGGGIGGATVFLDTNRNGQRDRAVTTFVSAPTPAALADRGAAFPHVTVAGVVGRVVDLDVQLDAEFEDASPLRVGLITPQGNEINLEPAADGGEIGQITVNGRTFTPVRSPEETVGNAANGRWSLHVPDSGGGMLNGWSITVTSEEDTSMTAADGSYAFANLPQGVYRVVQAPIPGYELNGVEGTDSVPPPSPPGLDIQFRIAPELLPNPDLERGLDEAASIVESLFLDPLTAVIDIKLGDADSLAFADSELFSRTYVETKDLLQSDAAADEQIVFELPPLDMSFRVPEGFSVEEIGLTRANLLALGVSPARLVDGQSSEFDSSVKRDAQIVYNINEIENFDFDRRDGVSSNKHDFVGLTVHELLHALGLLSVVDHVKLVLDEPVDPATGEPRSVRLNPAPLDLFRFAPGVAAVDFTNSTRMLIPGVPSHVYDGGVVDATTIAGVETVGEIPMSDGEDQQAGHVLDDVVSGVRLGIMDPTATTGTVESVTDVDIRLMGLIGWDVATSQVGSHAIALSPGDNRRGLDFVNRVVRIAGDANNDGEVSFSDFLQFSAHFSKTDAVWEDGDFDGNGIVDFSDFLLLSNNFGKRR